MLIPFINSLIILDVEGNRLLAKYYDGKKKNDQIATEAILHKKSKATPAKMDGNIHSFWIIFYQEYLNLPDLTFTSTTAEVILLETELFVFKSGIECKFFISGPIEEVRRVVCLKQT